MPALPRTTSDQFPLPANALGNFYRHVDGGCYQVLSRGKETETDVEMVAYVHRFPFEPTWSFRTAENFLRHPGAGRGPFRGSAQTARWIPAFAGMSNSFYLIVFALYFIL